MASRKKKTVALEDLPGEADATAPLDWQGFLQAAAPVLKTLELDLHTRAKASLSVAASLAARHQEERARQRTGDSLVEWTEHFIEQVAAAWLLSAVFVRTLEDRGLLGHNRLGGPGAHDSLKLFFELAPSLTEREYLLTVFRELQRFPATQALFDARHNPVWLLTPSAGAARALLQLFQAPRADVPAFRFGQQDTGFLGWLYQDLNANVRERFALLQTPRFVEDYILDRTLETAIAKFGLDDTTLIDPTCGSGHFLLGAFERLFEHRLQHEPGLSHRVAATKALDAVFGADLNPYAVGIARFRLTLAFLDKAGFTRLQTAPALPLHLVVADSLLHNPHLQQGDLADLAPTLQGWRGQEYALEDEAAAKDVLHRQYAAVVGNPPYITVKDPVLRERYRGQYPKSAAGKYSVAAPFTERFFQLAKRGGRVGMITANSFMKREFGKKLIEQYLPAVNLDLVVNTSGAYIPGHGTPTVLLFGSHEAPVGPAVTTVLASRGEPSTPDDPAQGLVWRSIAEHTDEVGFENDYISVTKTERTTLEKHPWSLGGGGAAELKELLEERAEKRLGDVVESIGVGGMSNADDVYLVPKGVWSRFEMDKSQIRSLVIGEDLRDWSHSDTLDVYFPYDGNLELVEPSERTLHLLWPYRSALWNRAVFGGGTYRSSGRTWWEWHQLTRERYRTPLTITFAFVATHNHFVLDRGGKVFKQSAPIIKLPDTASEDDHLALLAYLNSSTACFWLKQVMMNKGATSDRGVLQADEDKFRYEFDGTKLSKLPIPPLTDAALPLLAAELTSTCGSLSEDGYFLALKSGRELESQWAAVDADHDSARRRGVALQEEIDWRVYRLFGLESATDLVDELNAVGSYAASDRPFMADAEATGIRARRRQAISRNPFLSLLEQSEYKRRWYRSQGKFNAAPVTDSTLKRRAYEEFASDICEQQARCSPTTRSQREIVSAAVAASPILEAACHLAMGLHDLNRDIRDRIEGDSVPFLAAWRFTDSGLARFAEWEHTWDLQRREDAGEKIESIPVPPKYGQGDFRSPGFYKLRGPLDVPKERFISYPGCESDEDGEPVYGWAGWDHEQRARALATLYVARRDQESWSAPRLVPMLAGLLELLPWLKQWHGAPHDDYGGVSPGSYYDGFLDEECRKLGVSHTDLRAWRPQTKKAAKAGKAKAPKASAATDSVAPAGDDAPAAPKKRGRPKKRTDG